MEHEPLDSLIRRAKRRDADAFDQIIDLYAARMYGFFYRLCRSGDDAEDLLQELFLRVVRNIGAYNHTGQFDAWLFRIATNLVRDRGRKVMRAPVVLDDETDGVADALADFRASSGVERMEQTESVDQLERALIRLTPNDREILMLRHYSQLSFAQIAEIVQAPVGTVLARAHRALGKLRAIMEPFR